MIDGPFLRWKKAYKDFSKVVNLDDFAMNFYLAFRGGNAGKKPRAILYDEFYIVAFPRDLELCCLFMKPKGIDNNIQQLNKVAHRIMNDMSLSEEDEEDQVETEESVDEAIEEIKRLIVNLLSGIEMSTPELRRYFKLNNSQIWKVMADLENSRQVKRTSTKKGRSVFWTAV